MRGRGRGGAIGKERREKRRDDLLGVWGSGLRGGLDITDGSFAIRFSLLSF